MRSLVALVALVAADPVYACHRFSVWHYPYPQRCSVVHARYQATAPVDRSWYVEITAMPPETALTDMRQVEDPRGYAILKLKSLMH